MAGLRDRAAPGSVIVCVGGAKCGPGDLAAARDLLGSRPHSYAACNDAGIDLPGPLRLWATLHPEKMGDWARRRTEAGNSLDGTWLVGSVGGRKSHVHALIARGAPGSSGLFVARVARIELGFARVILCGIPMDGQPNRYRVRERGWRDFDRYRKGWHEAAGDPEFAPFVRSMSGWTSELLGRPDAAWLDGA